jgi:ribosomal protein S18 acetylase RimI-like enzyme
VLVSLAPRHRRPLAKLLERTVELTTEEKEVALELVDDALTHPGKSSYRFLLWSTREAPAERDGSELPGAESVEGYVCFGATPMTESAYDLYWLVVDPTARRHGIGRKLVLGAEEAIRGAGGSLVRVETAGTAAYTPARALYEKVDYRAAARIPDFYAPGNDLWILVKDLRQPT